VDFDHLTRFCVFYFSTDKLPGGNFTPSVKSVTDSSITGTSCVSDNASDYTYKSVSDGGSLKSEESKHVRNADGTLPDNEEDWEKHSSTPHKNDKGMQPTMVVRGQKPAATRGGYDPSSKLRQGNYVLYVLLSLCIVLVVGLHCSGF